MKTVTVSVSGASNDHTATSVSIDRKRGDIWTRVGHRDLVTNKDGAFDFNLREGDRLVIEPYPNIPQNVVYDAEQAIARRPTASEAEALYKAAAPSAAPAGKPSTSFSGTQSQPKGPQSDKK